MSSEKTKSYTVWLDVEEVGVAHGLLDAIGDQTGFRLSRHALLQLLLEANLKRFNAVVTHQLPNVRTNAELFDLIGTVIGGTQCE